MPSRFPTPDDVPLPGIQAGRPVAAYDASGYGRGAQALAQGVSNLGQGVQKAADDVVALRTWQDQQAVENGLMTLSNAYLQNRNQYQFSNDPADIDNWRKANEDARNRFNQIVPPSTTPLGRHAALKADVLNNEESLRVTERNHALRTSMAEADTLVDIDNLRNSATYDPSARPDVTEGALLESVHTKIDRRRDNGFLTPEKAELYKQHAATTFVEAKVRAAIKAAQAEPDPERKDAIYASAAAMMGGSLRNRGGIPPSGGIANRIVALISRAETGTDDPTLPAKAIGNISADSEGSKSYGVLGLNSLKGSAGEFQKEYGQQFGLTASPGTPEFDAQWQAAANTQTDSFRAAQVQFFNNHILPGVSHDLATQGIPDDIAADPRVQAYFADRRVQMGTYGLQNVPKAWAAANGDVPTFLRNMNAADGTDDSLNRYFSHALASGVYSRKAHDTRLAERLNGALAIGGPPPAGEPPSVPAKGSQASDTAASDIPAHPFAPLARAALSPQQMDALFRLIEVSRRADEADAARQQALQARQEKQRSDDTQAVLFHNITSGDPSITKEQLFDLYVNRQLNMEGYEKMVRLLDEHAKAKEQEGPGTAYYDLLERVHPPPGSHLSPITDPAWVYDQYAQLARSGGLTKKGADHLIAVIKGDREHVDQNAINDAKAGLREYAKRKMGLMEDQPGLGPIFRNPKGREVFESQFRPLFEQRYEAYMRDPKADPWKFLTRENVDSLIDEIYPEAQRKADSLFSARPGEPQPSETGQPGFFSRLFGAQAILPSPPEGIPAEGWRSVVGRPPTGENGQPMAAESWARRINMLLADPSPEMIAAFDQRYGEAGFSARQILQTLRPDATATAVAGETPPLPGTYGVTRPWPGEPGGPAEPAPPPFVTAAAAASPEAPLSSAAAPAPPAGETPAERRARYAREQAATAAQEEALAARQRSEGIAAREAAAEAAARAYAQRSGRGPGHAQAQGGADMQRLDALIVDLERRVAVQRAQQERPDISANERDFAALMGDAYQYELDAQRKRRTGDDQDAVIDEELGALARREAYLRSSGVRGAIFDAQMRRIDARRRELESRRHG